MSPKVDFGLCKLFPTVSCEALLPPDSSPPVVGLQWTYSPLEGYLRLSIQPGRRAEGCELFLKVNFLQQAAEGTRDTIT